MSWNALITIAQLLREPCDIQYFCFPSLQSHLHLTPDICIMASLHPLSVETQDGSEVVRARVFGDDGPICLPKLGLCGVSMCVTWRGLNDFRLNLAH